MGRPWGDHSNRSPFCFHAQGSLFPLIIGCLNRVEGVGLICKTSPSPWGASPSPWGGHGEVMGRPWGGHSNRSPFGFHAQGSLSPLIISCLKCVEVVGLICQTSPSPWGGHGEAMGRFSIFDPTQPKMIRMPKSQRFPCLMYASDKTYHPHFLGDTCNIEKPETSGQKIAKVIFLSKKCNTMFFLIKKQNSTPCIL